MEAAKNSVKSFLSKSDKHDTSIHETVAPAVQKEQINREEHEHATTAVDREVHQDHYHTTEQPVTHSEVLPEQHHHNLMPVQERKFEHDNHDEVKRKVAEQQSQYTNETHRVEGQHTTTAQPSVAGEHVHHHVYETIQPVVHKQTVEPHVVHTTVPIHEVHHNQAKHHSATALPAMSMDEFKQQGGMLEGRGERKDKFNDCPPEMIAGANRGHSTNQIPTTSSTTTDSTTNGNKISALDPGRTSEFDRSTSATTGSVPAANGGSGVAARSSGGPLNSHKHDTTGHQHPEPASYGNDMHPENTAPKKASLMDKLNPSKDADGDGKAGFMK